MATGQPVPAYLLAATLWHLVKVVYFFDICYILVLLALNSQGRDYTLVLVQHRQYFKPDLAVLIDILFIRVVKFRQSIELTLGEISEDIIVSEYELPHLGS